MEKEEEGVKKNKHTKKSKLKYKRILLDKETMLCLNVIYDSGDRQNFKIFLDDGYELQK